MAEVATKVPVKPEEKKTEDVRSLCSILFL